MTNEAPARPIDLGDLDPSGPITQVATLAHDLTRGAAPDALDLDEARQKVERAIAAMGGSFNLLKGPQAPSGGELLAAFHTSIGGDTDGHRLTLFTAVGALVQATTHLYVARAALAHLLASAPRPTPPKITELSE